MQRHNLKQTDTFLNTQKNDLLEEKPWESYEKSSSETTFEENNSNFNWNAWCYPQTLIENLPSEIKFTERESKLPIKQNNKEEKEILPFVTQYQTSVSTIKEA